MPQKSDLYYAEYTPYYYSDGYYGSDGKKLKTMDVDEEIFINNTPIHITGVSNIDIKVQSAGTSPTFFYVFDKDILGAKYCTLISSYYGYVHTKVKADITGSTGGIQLPGEPIRTSVELNGSAYGMGDLSVMPLWLDWSRKHYDIWVNYGFYAPVGRYNSKSFTNIGRGFWSHEIGAGVAYYLQEERQTAFVANLTYEINQEQRDTAVTPGQNIALEYGISQYFSQRLEVALSGYSMFQVTRDYGGTLGDEGPNSYIHAIGPEFDYCISKGKFYVAGKYLYEYAAMERTRGQLATINLYYIF